MQVSTTELCVLLHRQLNFVHSDSILDMQPYNEAFDFHIVALESSSTTSLISADCRKSAEVISESQTMLDNDESDLLVSVLLCAISSVSTSVAIASP